MQKKMKKNVFSCDEYARKKITFKSKNLQTLKAI